MTVTDTPPPPDHFFSDATFDFEFRDGLGATAYDVGDPGMWLATARRTADGDRQSWFDGWTARADQLSALGNTAATQGDRHGVSWAYLSASAALLEGHGRHRWPPHQRGQRRAAPDLAQFPAASPTSPRRGSATCRRRWCAASQRHRRPSARAAWGGARSRSAAVASGTILHLGERRWPAAWVGERTRHRVTSRAA